MPSLSLMNLPREIIYLIFEYLNKEHIAYSFFGLNNQLTSAVTYFIGSELDLGKINNEIIFQFGLSTLLPSIGFNLRYLSIRYPYDLSILINYIQNYCPNLDILTIHCCSQIDDIRRYATYLIHHQLISLTLISNNQIVGEQISIRLLNKYENEDNRAVSLASSLILHLESTNDLNLLKHFSESSYLTDGLYMIECLSTGEWLTDSKDDLCIISKKLHRDSIFSIKQIDIDRCSREYELFNEGTQRRVTVLISCEEERWLSSSILSSHRKESSHSCSSFTFERVGNDNQFYIRPCYARAKRLQASGKRIIVSLCDNQIPVPCAATAAFTGLSTLTTLGNGSFSYACFSFNWTATAITHTISFKFRQDPTEWHMDDVSIFDSSANQLIINGGFEDGSYGTAVSLPIANNWTWSGSLCGCCVGVINSSSKTGSYSWNDGCVGATDNLSQSFSTTIGNMYFITWWLETGGGGGSASFDAIIT